MVDGNAKGLTFLNSLGNMKNMNSLSKHLTTIIIAIIVIAGCIYSGRVEYNDSVLSGMSTEKYKYIRDSLGRSSRSDIVSEYINNKHYYDSIDY